MNDAVDDSVCNAQSRNQPPSSNEPVHPDIDLQLPETDRPALQDEASNSDRDPQPPEVDPPASQDETDTSSAEWYGMKFVADNIDKTVKSRYMRVDRRNTSMHYVHMYAVRDRVNLTHSSEVPPSVPNVPNLDDLLPSQIDDSALSTLFAAHIARILTTYMPFFQENFGDVVQLHIPHLYSADMSKKSQVVSNTKCQHVIC